MSYVERVLTGVWLDKAARSEKGFKSACKRSGVEVLKTNLSSPKAGAEISRWISDATDGFISPRIDLDPLALACVSSVLYLKDAWDNPFVLNLVEKYGLRLRGVILSPSGRTMHLVVKKAPDGCL